MLSALREFICASALLGLLPWSPPSPLAVARHLPSLPHGLHGLGRRGVMIDGDIPFRTERGAWPFGRRSAEEVESTIYRIRVGEKKNIEPPSWKEQGEAGKGACAQETWGICCSLVWRHKWGKQVKKKAWHQRTREFGFHRVCCFELWNKLSEKNIRLDLLNK